MNVVRRSLRLAAALGLGLAFITSGTVRADELPHPQNFSGFPDFGYMVSLEEYVQNYADHPVFKLKADFPAEMPADSNLPEALKIDFVGDWEKYLLSVRDYCFDGNIPTWNPHENEERGWYHIPWLHPTSDVFPPNGGTEGFHGLIKEAPVGPYQLASTQTGSYQVYAITLVNEYAGYTMGKMWANPKSPDPRTTDHRYGGGFPIGTVFCKLLFVDAPSGGDKIPFLDNPIEWQGYITEDWNSPTRSVRSVRLLQMDIMVRDPRADDTIGWVLGTFAYNGELNARNCKGREDDMACRFQNLVPLGLAWGDDPEVTDNTINTYPYTSTKTNPNIKESIINRSPDLPPQHLGWGGRLNGPADLNTSSCVSCHTASEYPAVAALVPPGATVTQGFAPPPTGGTPDWMKYFQNIPAATSSSPQAFSTDFSLQVAISLQNFATAASRQEAGYWAVEYGAQAAGVNRAGVSP